MGIPDVRYQLGRNNRKEWNGGDHWCTCIVFFPFLSPWYSFHILPSFSVPHLVIRIISSQLPQNHYLIELSGAIRIPDESSVAVSVRLTTNSHCVAVCFSGYTLWSDVERHSVYIDNRHSCTYVKKLTSPWDRWRPEQFFKKIDNVLWWSKRSYRTFT